MPPASQLPAWTGLVTLPAPKAAFFTHFEEVGNLQQQLPQFLPRTTWPNPELDHTNLPHVNTNVDWGNSTQVAAVHQSVGNFYSRLSPMLPFQASGNAEEYRGSAWRSHVAVLNELLRDTLPRKASLSTAEIVSLMNICSYGLYDTVWFLNPWRLRTGTAPTQVPQPVTNPRPARRSARTRGAQSQGAAAQGSTAPAPAPSVVTNFEDAFQMDLGAGSFFWQGNSPSTEERQTVNRSIEGRRWVVAPVKHGDDVWSMTIFDRTNAELYVFDSVADNREERVEAIVHLWMKFWNWLGLPNSFQYFVPKAQRATTLQASGYRAILWLFENLRNQVGEQILVASPQGVPVIPRKDIVVVSQTPRPPIDESAMFIHDALPTSFRSPSHFWPAVTRMFTVILCNELGLRQHPELTKPGPNNTLAQLESVADAISHSTRIPVNQYFTASGGPHFVAQQGATFGPYSLDQPRAFHRPTGNHPGILIENGSQIYAATFNQPQNVVWPDQASYNAARPVNRAPVISGVIPTSIQPQDEEDTETYREFHVSLDNQQTATQRVPIDEPLVITLTSIRRETAADGTPGIRFFLNVGTSGNVPVQTPVTIPLPPDFFGGGFDGGDDGHGGGGDGGGGGGHGNDSEDDDSDDGGPGSSGTNPNTPRRNHIPVDQAFRLTPSPHNNLTRRGVNTQAPSTPPPRRRQNRRSGGTRLSTTWTTDQDEEDDLATAPGAVIDSARKRRLRGDDVGTRAARPTKQGRTTTRRVANGRAPVAPM